MRIDKITTELINAVKQNEYFNDINVIAAYPKGKKPTRLERICIAFGISEVNISSAYIDEHERTGTVTVFADIFVPLKYDCGIMPVIFSKMCESLSGFNILSITAGRISTDSDIQAYLLKAAVTVGDIITFGGD